MINYDIPYTFENAENPWIMDRVSADYIEIKGNKISAQYLWSLTADERIKCLKDVFNYYRKHGFPYKELSRKTVIAELNKLKKIDSDKVITSEGFISNANNVALDLCRYICKEKFYKAKGDTKTYSVEDVFNDDEMFMKVLKNRMGWNTSKEGGIERPYMFGINDDTIINGIKNSALGYGVSNFRPIIAKYFYERYLKDIENPTIYDYSAGWGARSIAAMVLGYNYIATDPLTADDINKFTDAFGDDMGFGDSTSTNVVYKHGSEQYIESLENKVDLCFSCPPYFTLERYSDDTTQSYNEFDNYRDWLELYWKLTVENCYKYCKQNAKFTLIIKDSYKKFNLKDDMCKIIEDCGFKFFEEFQYKTTTNHLSGKAKTKRLTKNTEYILTYVKY